MENGTRIDQIERILMNTIQKPGYSLGLRFQISFYGIWEEKPHWGR
jgi:hypothetical protein